MLEFNELASGLSQHPFIDVDSDAWSSMCTSKGSKVNASEKNVWTFPAVSLAHSCFLVLDRRQLLGPLLGQQGLLRHHQRRERVRHGEWSPRQGLPHCRNCLKAIAFVFATTWTTVFLCVCKRVFKRFLDCTSDFSSPFDKICSLHLSFVV
jgi:hypothetical protein